MRTNVPRFLLAALASLAACGDADGLASLHEIRPFELRLTDEQEWAPCTIPSKTGSLVQTVRCEEVPLSHPALFALAGEHASGASDPDSNIVGVALIELALRSSDWHGYTSIIDRLRHAAALEAAGANVSLATAHAVRGSIADDPTDLLRALDLLLRSRDAVPNDEVSAFNQAVLLERLHLTDEALGAWNDYLELDAESDWADEARERIRRLDVARATAPTSAASAAPLPMDVQTAREVAIDRLLPAWAVQYRLGNEEQARVALDSARAIGETLAHTNGERVIEEAVTAVDAAIREGRAARVAAGLAAWGEGRALYGNANYAAAASPLAEAVQLLESEPIALGGWPQLYAGGIHIVARQLDDAERYYDAVRSRASLETNPSLWARAAWGAGLVSFLQNDFPLALARYDSAAMVFQRIGEEDNIGGIQFLLMETYAGLGQRRQSFEHTLRALANLEDRPGAQMRYNTLIVLGVELRTAGLAHAAAAVLSEGVDAAQRTNQPKNLVEALSRLAAAQMDIGRNEAARTTVDRALHEYAKVSDRFMTIWSDAELARAHARVLREKDPEQARAVLSTAVDFYRSTNNPILLFTALADRASLALATGDIEAALADLEDAVVDLGHRTREARGDAATVASLLESAAPVFDGLIAIHARRGDSGTAFEYAETARAVALAATRGSSDAANPLLSGASDLLPRMQARLGSRQMLLHTAVLPDRTYLWFITADTVVMHEAAITERELAEAVQRFHVFLEADLRASADSTGARLHDLLLGPMPESDSIDELIVVPDKALQRLPFAALRNSVTGRYVIEDVTIVLAPSAAFALREGASREWRLPERVLLVADPAFDANRFPELPRLQSARQEIERVATHYRDTVMLEGDDATIDAFRDAVARADLVHFAGHALYRPDRPELSYLVFAGDGEQEAAFFARDIRGMRLPTAPLVVLSACETALPEVTRTGGYGALARAFLVAGAPAVIGSTWLVDDQATARLMAEFHAQLVTGLAPAAALRAAQTRAISSGERISAWSSFRYEGASVSSAS